MNDTYIYIYKIMLNLLYIIIECMRLIYNQFMGSIKGLVGTSISEIKNNYNRFNDIIRLFNITESKCMSINLL
jgi:hypothetical protein